MCRVQESADYRLKESLVSVGIEGVTKVRGRAAQFIGGDNALRLTIGNKTLDALRVTSFTASRQRGRVSVLGKHIGRDVNHLPLPARDVLVSLSKRYKVEFYQTDKRKLIIVVNGDAVWFDG